uniref:Suppressor of cytokine signalling protein n=1 Tax=Homo sapiens TaxID=9606 RepID=Q9NSA8_HUMAN|nr:suppressor of cytokine signalling protein [Homo sapiens]
MRESRPGAPRSPPPSRPRVPRPAASAPPDAMAHPSGWPLL